MQSDAVRPEQANVGTPEARRGRRRSLPSSDSDSEARQTKPEEVAHGGMDNAKQGLYKLIRYEGRKSSLEETPQRGQLRSGKANLSAVGAPFRLALSLMSSSSTILGEGLTDRPQSELLDFEGTAGFILPS